MISLLMQNQVCFIHTKSIAAHGCYAASCNVDIAHGDGDLPGAKQQRIWRRADLKKWLFFNFFSKTIPYFTKNILKNCIDVKRTPKCAVENCGESVTLNDSPIAGAYFH